MVTKVPAPSGSPDNPLQALIFDSLYDSYKGVIVFCRIKEGRVKKGTEILMMATGAKAEVVEVGYFGPGQFIPCEELSAGMVGYITASIKNVKDTAVGDTVTDAKNPCAEPLPGYKKVNSMVFCGMYPADGAKYPDLRDALEKLQLNDAALQYEPETSVALGFGFRCGFLGLLHLEIIQERLEREYNLDLVTTAPGVIYRVHKNNGDMVELTNPTNLPDPTEIDFMEEPIVSAEIMVTTEFIGSIMELCQERRGRYLGMEYIEETRALLKYELPLNEIIYDFFDALKSRSRGYASFDYDLKGYEESKLVKLDILINREEVDALSFIVHADSAYDRGRKMCEKLKDEIPRHLFEIPIQAAVGGKIIARETVKAMLPVHVFGDHCDMDRLMDLAEAYHLYVIEDATEALGTRYLAGTYKGKCAGTIGDYGAFSFNGNKIVTGSAGGMFLTDSKEDADKIRKWSTQSREAAAWYQHEELGYNYRMSNVVAGVVRGQLPYLKEHVSKEKRNI